MTCIMQRSLALDPLTGQMLSKTCWNGDHQRIHETLDPNCDCELHACQCLCHQRIDPLEHKEAGA